MEVHVYAHDRCQANLSMGWLVCACITIFHEVITIFFLQFSVSQIHFGRCILAPCGTHKCFELQYFKKKKGKKHCYQYKDFKHRCKGGYIPGKTPVSLPIREHLIRSQFFSKRNAFQIGFTPLPPPSIRKAYRTFSDNNRFRPSSRSRLSTTKLLRASLLSFSSREASADNIISTSSSFSPFPVSLHASSALRLASTRGRPGLQAT